MPTKLPKQAAAEKNIYDKFYKRLGLVIDWNIIDDLVVSDANILRPVKGAAFEYLFSLIFKEKFKVILGPGLGDSDIDKTLSLGKKDITMQIKPGNGNYKCRSKIWSQSA